MTTTTTTSHDDQLTGAAHEACDRWGCWVTTRRFYGPPPLAAGILAKLSSKTRAPAAPGGPDAVCSSLLHALNFVIAGKAMDDERVAFELFYRHRCRNIKAVASELGISRKTFYARVGRFRDRVWSEAQRVAEAERLQAERLPSQLVERLPIAA